MLYIRFNTDSLVMQRNTECNEDVGMVQVKRMNGTPTWWSLPAILPGLCTITITIRWIGFLCQFWWGGRLEILWWVGTGSANYAYLHTGLQSCLSPVTDCLSFQLIVCMLLLPLSCSQSILFLIFGACFVWSDPILSFLLFQQTKNTSIKVLLLQDPIFQGQTELNHGVQ